MGRRAERKRLSGWLRHALACLLLPTWVTADTGTGPAEFTDCEHCPTMVAVPAGSITIGSSKHAAYRRQGERLATRAAIAEPFAMAKTEVTLQQYRAFVSATGHRSAQIVYRGEVLEGCNYFDGTSYGFVTAHDWENPGYPQREDEPVVCVSWSDANAYASWLSETTGRAYRVPSSVEFEYAMRAGTETPWFWGTDPSDACEYANVGDRTFGQRFPQRVQFGCDDGYIFTTRVARFKANGFGLHDMLGNAWEWTNDCWHDDLTDAPVDGSAWLHDGGGDCEFRTPRGGSWISGPAWAHAAVRSKDGANYRSFMLGFRVAAELGK